MEKIRICLKGPPLAYIGILQDIKDSVPHHHNKALITKNSLMKLVSSITMETKLATIRNKYFSLFRLFLKTLKRVLQQLCSIPSMLLPQASD